MPEPERFPPDDPREWLNRARSDLSLARAVVPDVLLDDFCFHAQQAAEKAIKAVLISRNVEFPYVHDLAQLLELVEESGATVPANVRAATALTRFAILTRYPGLSPAPTEGEYRKAIQTAEAAVDWCSRLVAHSS